MNITLPATLVKTIKDCGFWESIPLWAVTLIGSLVVWILALVMIMTVYGRFFKLYLYVAIAPIPLSSFAGEETSSTGKAFLRSFAGVCLEGAIILLRFSDINYAVASKEDKEELFLGYSEILNSLDSGATTKITVNNRRLIRSQFEKTNMLAMAGDALDRYRQEYNSIVERNANLSCGVTQDKYMTITVEKKSVEEAMQLYRIFKTQFNESPHDYLLNIKFTYAKNLLTSTDMEVKEIAATIGYASVPQFQSTFKKLFNTTPNKYRQTYLKNN